MTLHFETSYEELLNQLHDGVYIVDRERRIRFWNCAAERITGYSQKQVQGQSCMHNILMHVDDSGTSLCQGYCPLAKTLQDGIQREAHVYLHHAGGHRVPVVIRVTPFIEDGQITGAAEVFIQDVSLLTALERIHELEKEALIDPLTEIGNRRFTHLRLESSLAEWQRRQVPFGVLFVDIDHFKKINDQYGHLTGDRVLKMVAATLSGNLRINDFAGRWGGEEFVLVAANVQRSELRNLAERLRMLVESSYLVLERDNSNGQPPPILRVTVSIGAALVQPGDTLQSLIDRADEMMYASKRQGRNRVTIAPE